VKGADFAMLNILKPLLQRNRQPNNCFTCRLKERLIFFILFFLAACSFQAPDEINFERDPLPLDVVITPGIKTIPQDKFLFVELHYSLKWDKDDCYDPWGEALPWVYRVEDDGVWFASPPAVSADTIGFTAIDFSYIDLGWAEITPIEGAPFTFDAVQVLRVDEDGNIVVEVFDERFLIEADESLKFDRTDSTERPGCQAYYRYELINYGWLDRNIFHFEQE